MGKLKLYIKEIIIAILAVLFLSKCTQSCNRGSEITKKENQIQQLDSVINEFKDSVTMLNTQIKIYEERTAGLESSIKIQEEAQKRLVEAKKQVQVTVKNK